MPQIVLRPAPMELGLFPEQYDALVFDLQAAGYDVEIVPPEEYRSRSGLPDPETFYNLIVLVRDSPEYPLIAAALIAIIQKRLRGRAGRRTRQGMLHLPTGEEHRFEMHDDE